MPNEREGCAAGGLSTKRLPGSCGITMHSRYLAYLQERNIDQQFGSGDWLRELRNLLSSLLMEKTLYPGVCY